MMTPAVTIEKPIEVQSSAVAGVQLPNRTGSAISDAAKAANVEPKQSVVRVIDLLPSFACHLVLSK
jgi:hypothetical protein